MKTMWDMVLMVLIIYELIMLPLDLCFVLPFEDTLLSIDIFITIYFFLDICLNFHTSYTSETGTVYDHKLIAKHYFRKWFWIDFISSFPFGVILKGGTDSSLSSGLQALSVLRALRLVRIARIFKIKKIIEKLKEFFGFSHGINGIFKLFKLCFVIIFVAHWCACFFHYIAFLRQEEGYEDNWITRWGYDGTSWD